MSKWIQFTGDTLKIGSFSLTFSLSGVIEIIIFAVVSYYIILWIKRTKAWTLLKGAGILLLVFVLAKIFKLNNIVSLFESALGSIVIAAIVILQPELRRALEQLGTKNLITGVFRNNAQVSTRLNGESIDAITRALAILGKNRVGALIVIERNIDLNEYIETGISLDANISSALLEQVFEHNTPLHDGAVIIRNNRIVSATCYLPLSQNTEISKELGTRHRAGLGISEVSDAVTLIASEETGLLSVAINGQLQRDVSTDEIREILLSGDFLRNKEETAEEAADKRKEGLKDEE